jgi:hypothetical protein
MKSCVSTVRAPLDNHALRARSEPSGIGTDALDHPLQIVRRPTDPTIGYRL